MERAMGIEPTSEAWEASILPLYDARSFSNDSQNITASAGHATAGYAQAGPSIMYEDRFDLSGIELQPMLQGEARKSCNFLSNTRIIRNGLNSLQTNDGDLV
jgi:hypothetical protein